MNPYYRDPNHENKNLFEKNFGIIKEPTTLYVKSKGNQNIGGAQNTIHGSNKDLIEAYFSIKIKEDLDLKHPSAFVSSVIDISTKGKD